jgi:hypothetical protein
MNSNSNDTDKLDENLDNKILNTEIKDKNNNLKKHSNKFENEGEEHTNLLNNTEIKNKNDNLNISSSDDILCDLLAVSIPTMLFFSCLLFQQTLSIMFVSNQITNLKLQESAINGIGIANYT